MNWYPWALVGGGILVGIPLLAAGVGVLLPVGHTASVSGHLDASPDDVWRLLTDVEAFPGWRSGVRSVTRLEDRDGLPAWREESRQGAMTLVVEALDPPRRMVARIADEDLPFGGSWSYEVEPDGDGARLTLTEDGEVYNPIFRFVSRFVMGHDATMRAYMDDVRARLEADSPGPARP